MKTDRLLNRIYKCKKDYVLFDLSYKSTNVNIIAFIIFLSLITFRLDCLSRQNNEFVKAGVSNENSFPFFMVHPYYNKKTAADKLNFFENTNLKSEPTGLKKQCYLQRN